LLKRWEDKDHPAEVLHQEARLHLDLPSLEEPLQNLNNLEVLHQPLLKHLLELLQEVLLQELQERKLAPEPRQEELPHHHLALQRPDHVEIPKASRLLPKNLRQI